MFDPFKKILPPRLDFPGASWFWLAGWILAVMLAIGITPHLVHRLMVKMPPLQRAEWNRVMEQKKAQLAAGRWADSRPLHLLFGDSEIELGRWYDLFGGRFAVRNCGLSRATIKDVTELVKALPDEQPESVILMCGINNLFRIGPADCIGDYEQLLEQTRRRLQPRKILVLSVMPVRESPRDRSSARTNERVRAFNVLLQELCRQQHAHFVNVNEAVADAQGALAGSLTMDGLHLNDAGYQKVASVIRRELEPPPSQK
jgi:lysophospholipase L1-like esterase